MDLTRGVKNIISFIPGWHTNRKIIVIESDDWGSVRMPDKATYNVLLSKGIRVDNCPYNRYDCLASDDDLSSLFEVLNCYRDINGNPPVITANCVLANPDFDKIRRTDFEEYHYELFTETLKKYPKHSHSFQLWNEGIDKNMFHPQFHGREHLNVPRWMKALKDNLPETRLAFDLRLFGLSTFISNEVRRSYLAAYDVYEKNDINQINEITEDGLSIFRTLFGYDAKSFIAPNYIWPSLIEKNLSEQNIKYIKGEITQHSPVIDSLKIKKIRHFTGQKNSFNQIYLVRNCWFEPSFSTNEDSVNECLVQIENAFKWKKPAIISMHRVNFIGTIEESNREKNLRQLRILLSEIQKRWREVEFITADKLGDLIVSELIAN
jgi:hypothetical protein